jgi:hypothetical protein
MTTPEQPIVAKQVLAILHPAAPCLQDALDTTVPLSDLIAIVRTSLAKNPFFPPDLHPNALGDGAIIERRSKHLFLVHERSEVGQLRYSAVSSRSYLFLRNAVLRYLRHYDSLLRVKGIRIQRWS